MNAIVVGIVTLGLAGFIPLPPAVPSAPDATQQQQQQQQGEQRELIDINAATAEQLQRVPGIGETLARRIIEFRAEHGPFEKVDDLLNVQGIGTTTLDKMRPFLTVKPKG